MTGPEANKRPRADNSPVKNTHMQPRSHQASPSLAASEMPGAPGASVLIPRAPTDDSTTTRVLLERLLASHEDLTAEVVRLRHSVDIILHTLQQAPAGHRRTRESQITYESQAGSASRRMSQHQPLPAFAHSAGRRFGAVPPSLANIVSPQSQAAVDPVFSEHPSASESPTLQYRYGVERGRAASSGDAAASIADGSGANAGLPPTQRSHAHDYPPATRFHITSPPMSLQTTVTSSVGSQVALPPPAGLAQPTIVSRNTQGFPRVQSPTAAVFGSQTRFSVQSPSPSAPLSAPPSSLSAYLPARHASAHRSEYRSQQHGAALPRLSHPMHQQHVQQAALASPHLQHTSQAVLASPHRIQPLLTHGDQTVQQQSLTRLSAARPHSSSQYLRGSGPQRESMGTSPYASMSTTAPGMMIDATPAPKPSSPPYLHGYPGVAPLTGDSAASSGMVESPTGSTGARLHLYPSTPSGRSYSTDPGAQQKQEKNRFQANIRAFVDQHFTVAKNKRWDYQQSFKAPSNSETTQEIVEAFNSLHGNTHDRIQHGLGVYFSSLKAKYRSSEEKTMIKQQRDRRRARRIKKATGRRKVFDRSQYPFLPSDFDPKRYIVPQATSPEHTDDDNEVRVGVLPWRLEKYSQLFHHLDTMRTKRTIRLCNPQLSGGSVPPPDIPDYMIDPDYLSMDRTQRSNDPDQDPEEQNPDPEEDIEMGSSSD
ncbi:hypothetical protein IW148_003527 [Coemansia sp. RSA 1199]|nr:hypothetical protein IW148_003527 [Coemansia sp. RSA 1199]